jgi:hypothetical protein
MWWGCARPEKNEFVDLGNNTVKLHNLILRRVVEQHKKQRSKLPAIVIYEPQSRN